MTVIWNFRTNTRPLRPLSAGLRQVSQPASFTAISKRCVPWPSAARSVANVLRAVATYGMRARICASVKQRKGLAGEAMSQAVSPLRAGSLPLGVMPRGLSRVQAAEKIGVSPTKFDELVGDGRMPKPKRVDARRLWDTKAAL